MAAEDVQEAVQRGSGWPMDVTTHITFCYRSTCVSATPRLAFECAAAGMAYSIMAGGAHQTWNAQASGILSAHITQCGQVHGLLAIKAGGFNCNRGGLDLQEQPQAALNAALHNNTQAITFVAAAVSSACASWVRVACVVPAETIFLLLISLVDRLFRHEVTCRGRSPAYQLR